MADEGNNWWKRTVASGDIPGNFMHYQNIGEGTLIRPWGEELGQCTPDAYVPPGETPRCNAALVRWEGDYLVVKSPGGDSYKFKYIERIPIGTEGNHTSGKGHELFIKEQDSCLVESSGEFVFGLAPMAVREVVYRLKHGAGRCFTTEMKVIPAPQPLPQNPPVVAMVEPEAKPEEVKPQPEQTKPQPPPPKSKSETKGPKPKPIIKKSAPKAPSVKAPLPLPRPKPRKIVAEAAPPPPPSPKVEPPAVRKPPLEEICRTELPNKAKELWNSAHVPEPAELERFDGYRCGYFYQQSKPMAGGRYSPMKNTNIDRYATILTLQTEDGPQQFELIDDGDRIWARHVNPNKWMIPPHMSPDGHSHGTYGPIEVRILKSGELMFRYLIPSNDGKDYPYAYAIARRGIEI